VTLNRPLVVAEGSSAAPQTGAGVIAGGGGGDHGDGARGWAVMRGGALHVESS
jgi:hypothetical protein